LLQFHLYGWVQRLGELEKYVTFGFFKAGKISSVQKKGGVLHMYSTSTYFFSWFNFLLETFDSAGRGKFLHRLHPGLFCQGRIRKDENKSQQDYQKTKFYNFV